MGKPRKPTPIVKAPASEACCESGFVTATSRRPVLVGVEIAIFASICAEVRGPYELTVMPGPLNERVAPELKLRPETMKFEIVMPWVP